MRYTMRRSLELQIAIYPIGRWAIPLRRQLPLREHRFARAGGIGDGLGRHVRAIKGVSNVILAVFRGIGRRAC